MAKKLSLADKYALAKGNSAYTKKSANLRSTGGSVSGIDFSSRRRLPVQLKEQNTSRISESFKRTSLPGSFGSPIKTLHSIPASANRPLSMYKVLPYLPQKKAFKDSYIANKVLKDRPWLQRNAVTTVTKSNGHGMLGKLRSFLGSFKHQNDEFKRLSDSARKELNVRRQPDTKYVSHDEVLAPRTQSHVDNFDFDEVDANVQLAKKSLEHQRLLQKEADLEKKIQAQSVEIEELKNKHEREVYLTKARYEAQLADLKVEIHQLHELNANRHQEIEKDRLKEIENSVLKENESFLVFQRDTVQMLEDMKQRLERKEKYLARKEERLQAMAKNIRTSHTSPEESLSTTKSSNVPPISEGIGMNPPDSHAAVQTAPKTSFADINNGHVNEMSALNKEHVKVVNEIKRTEEQFNRLLSSLTKKFEILAMKDKLTESERELNTQMEELPQLLEATRTLESKPNNPYKKKLELLFSFLEEFRVEYAKDKLKAYKLYESEQILKTGHKVKQLTKSVRKKLAKRQEIISDIKSTIDQLLIDQNNNDVTAIRASIRGLGDISNLLQQQDIAVSTLKQLATIQKKLDEIQLIMGETE